MTLKPFLQAPLLYQVHALLAFAALIVGTLQIALPKGALPHRTIGYGWVGLMAMTALSSFGIRALHPGSFSVIHLSSLVTLVVLPFAVLHARRHRVRRHAIAMISLFVGALIIAGAFTLLPGRIMGRMVFGMAEAAHEPCA